MPRITISYRRSDSADITGRIFDRLEYHFGRGTVFMDIDAIPLGVNFRHYIDDALKSTDFFLVIIGPHWRGARENGTYRIDDRNDPVRVELEAALRNRLTVIPVLVGGASMPDPADLPEPLKELPDINAAVIDSGKDFRVHLERLTTYLDQAIAARSASDAAKVAEAAPEAQPQHAAPAVAKTDTPQLLHPDADAAVQRMQPPLAGPRKIALVLALALAVCAIAIAAVVRSHAGGLAQEAVPVATAESAAVTPEPPRATAAATAVPRGTAPPRTVAASTGNAGRGATLFARRCATCHTTGASSDKLVGPGLGRLFKPRPTAIKDIFKVPVVPKLANGAAATPQNVAHMIRNGYVGDVGAMPSAKAIGLSDADIADLVAYLVSLSRT